MADRPKEPRTQQLTVMTPEGTQQVSLPSLSTMKTAVWLLVALGGIAWGALVFVVDYRIGGQLEVHEVEHSAAEAEISERQDLLEGEVGYLVCRSAIRDEDRVGPNSVSDSILARPECRPWRMR